jgi:hypothetical protein
MGRLRPSRRGATEGDRSATQPRLARGVRAEGRRRRGQLPATTSGPRRTLVRASGHHYLANARVECRRVRRIRRPAAAATVASSSSSQAAAPVTAAGSRTERGRHVGRPRPRKRRRSKLHCHARPRRPSNEVRRLALHELLRPQRGHSSGRLCTITIFSLRTRRTSPARRVPDRWHGFAQSPSIGIFTSRDVPRPAGLTTSKLPSSASTRSFSPRRPEPLGSAPPIPSSQISRESRP